MKIPYVAPLAQNEFATLRDALAEGRPSTLDAWITRQADRLPTRERPFLSSFALLVAENLAETVPQAEFFHTRLDGAPQADALCARLVTATMNGDRQTVDALARTAEAWPVAERREVVAALVALLRRILA